jgi:glycogen phosphorylase
MVYFDASMSESADIRADAPRWWERAHGEPGFLVAYFSPEFGVDAGLPVYSGGLGVLAGDHVKAAADLGVPLVGVGLLYRKGYFQQTIAQGRQRELYSELDPDALGLTLERTADDEPVQIGVELTGELVLVQIWRVDVRGATIYLLDTDLESNGAEARAITDALYGGDREHRLRQELVLGVGGARALRALGLQPSVFHLNEGHAALLSLERIRAIVAEEGLGFDRALELVRRSTVFTTHTPVPAGNERFDRELAARYLEPLAAQTGVELEELLELGAAPGDTSFGLTPLALRTADFANGVSAVHGAVSRRMWRPLWPDLDEDDVPIAHVTNGVHVPSWVSPELAALLAEAGVRLDAGPDEQGWEHARDLDLGQLWQLRLRRKAELLDIVARRSSGQLGGEALSPDALTIGFARRFATYKRAALVLSDPERLRVLLGDSRRPLQLVFAGKAHPADEEGKAVLAEVVRRAQGRDARGRVAFLPEYDIALARTLVQGVDVWLNNPTVPQEASGTSGMKAALNGALNVSVLDGWWPEAYSSAIGWAIPEAVSQQGEEAERDELMRLLEEEVVPLFYERVAGGVPARWTEMMREAIATVGAGFNAARMVAEYAEHFYLPAHGAGTRVAGSFGGREQRD